MPRTGDALWFDAARCTACGLCVRACFTRTRLNKKSVQAPTQLANSEYKALLEWPPTNNPEGSPQGVSNSQRSE
ncbi:4Fe-4S binding protein [Candidatus Flexifilum breve]|uniref:4Fe-4S binding protein n=1 Tax=Candidatus Flexifilum breve TaxID=3140694 RepID=UPI003312FA87